MFKYPCIQYANSNRWKFKLKLTGKTVRFPTGNHEEHHRQ